MYLKCRTFFVLYIIVIFVFLIEKEYTILVSIYPFLKNITYDINQTLSIIFVLYLLLDIMLLIYLFHITYYLFHKNS